METREIEFAGRLPVEGYGPGFFRVGGAIHEGPLALLPSGPRPWGGLADLDPLLAEAAGFDILVLGTGPDLVFPDPAILARLDAAGIAVETMATGSACRSYNVLLAEERRVAAALLPL